jgi:cytochrome c1
MWQDRQSRNIILWLIFVTIMSAAIAFQPSHRPSRKVMVVKTPDPPKKSPMWNEVEGGIHLPTGLIADEHFDLVINNCTACHSADLIKQNHLTADGWISIIRWMQEKQNLWDLGPNEDEIVAYLAKNYAPTKQGRRKNLTIAKNDWYELED